MNIIAISNMLQIDVDVIVYLDGQIPEVKRFCPDSEFAWKDCDNDKPVKQNAGAYPNMTVLNYKGTHFNLVVEKNSIIAQSGTFSFQREIAGETTSKSDNTCMAKLEQKVEALAEALAKSQSEN